DFEGGLWSFGENNQGQLGIGNSQDQSNDPQKVMEIPPVKSVSCGYQHAVILDQDGSVWTVGRVTFTDNDFQDKPIRMDELASIVQVSSGWVHNMVLGADGRVWSFGHNED